MTTETALEPTTNDGTRKLALLKAVGLDRANPEQRELAMNIANRYGLDLLLKHLILVEGRAYITRDGLLHIAHRSGQLDGMETTEPVLDAGYWRATASVYRKDMSRPFTYYGRYPVDGMNKKFGPEMATKVAEVMALRRAFDVAAPTAEERWDTEVTVPEPAAAPKTLAERVAVKRAEVVPAAVRRTQLEAKAMEEGDPIATAPDPTAVETCGDEDASPMGLGYCGKASGHTGAHGSEAGTWPR